MLDVPGAPRAAACTQSESAGRSSPLDVERGTVWYNEFYARGGWKYSYWREYRWHRRHLVKRFRLRRGLTMLEVGCGSGFHTNLFNRMGYDCTGVDRSVQGIAWARDHFPQWAFECCDLAAMPFEPEAFDVVVARGLSLYHYDLHGTEAAGATHAILRQLRPGGLFVLIIVSDLSGRKERERVWQNKLEDYREHFAAFGKTWSVDWVDGMVICGLRKAE